MSYQAIDNIHIKRCNLISILLGINITFSVITMSGIIYFIFFITGDKFQGVFKNITKLVGKACQEFTC